MRVLRCSVRKFIEHVQNTNSRGNKTALLFWKPRSAFHPANFFAPPPVSLGNTNYRVPLSTFKKPILDETSPVSRIFV